MEDNDEKKKYEETKLEIYLDRQRLFSNECTDTEGKKIAHKVTDNYAHVVYTKKENVETNKYFLEQFSQKLPHGAQYIPFVLRYIRPDIFGRLLYNSVQKKKQY